MPANFHDLRHAGNTLAASSGARRPRADAPVSAPRSSVTTRPTSETASAKDRKITQQSGKKSATGKKAGGRKKKDGAGGPLSRRYKIIQGPWNGEGPGRGNRL
jgi:hypothetical protein